MRRRRPDRLSGHAYRSGQHSAQPRLPEGRPGRVEDAARRPAAHHLGPSLRVQVLLLLLSSCCADSFTPVPRCPDDGREIVSRRSGSRILAYTVHIPGSMQTAKEVSKDILFQLEQKVFRALQCTLFPICDILCCCASRLQWGSLEDI